VTEASSPYITFDRYEWAKLRAATPMTLNEADLTALHGINERLSLDEVTQIYLPLSRLLNLYVAASQALHRVTDTFLGSPAAKVPYVVAVAGSVAVGKSTTSRVLQALLARWPDHPTVDIVTTDGFLYPNHILVARDLMQRKGFPESYDLRRFVRFMTDVKAGVPEVRAPVYSHQAYDIVPGSEQLVRRPDIVIVEGLNVLQTGAVSAGRAPRVFVSDFIDFSIYVDAVETDIERWYVERFHALRRTVFANPAAYFHAFASLGDAEADAKAHEIWSDINAVNLRANIAPTRDRARLVLRKASDHTVQSVRLRKL
jgi:type I pantothenate kinase